MASLAVVVNFFNNRREARNTLFSLTPGYQGAAASDYEVIAIDNGSPEPLQEAEVRAHGAHFHHRFVAATSKSPAAAINAAVRESRAERVMVMIDGAHILSPGILRRTAEAFEFFERPFVATTPIHLGHKRQNLAMLDGYDQRMEDRLLESCGWRRNGYRLYAASRAFADGGCGWFGQMFESGCFAMRRDDFLGLGGLDERFQQPGGGLVNLAFFEKALADASLEYVMLLGEATFHQFHGGVSTNTPMQRHPFEVYHDEYLKLMGRPLARTTRRPYFIGKLPDEALIFTIASSARGLKDWQAALGPPDDLMAPLFSENTSR